MRVTPNDAEEIIAEADKLCRDNNYTKCFAKVPEAALLAFLSAGYSIEASVPRFISGGATGFFLGKYYDIDRSDPPLEELVTLKTILGKKKSIEPPCLNAPYHLRKLTHQDANALANLYAQVFPAYPFPIQDPEYIHQTMDEDVHYIGVFEGASLIGAGSAEVDTLYRNAEMTDLAVLEEKRGRSLTLTLLQALEEEMREMQIPTLFTIARLSSAGINVAFYRMGYRYSGTLKNNTRISTGIESMNIWYKHIL